MKKIFRLFIMSKYNNIICNSNKYMSSLLKFMSNHTKDSSESIHMYIQNNQFLQFFYRKVDYQSKARDIIIRT